VPSTQTLRLGVLGSGRGSNFTAITEAISAGRLNATVALVLSDVADAPILVRAAERGIPARHIHPGPFRTRLDDAAEAAYIGALHDAAVDWVVLAGFMRIIKAPFLSAFPHRVLNIHPSLLPSFSGLSAWKQALDYGVRVTGCTVHLVDAGVDTGPILAQSAVPIAPDDTAESLHERIQEAERVLFPEILARLSAAKLEIRGRHARFCTP
jgi:phosphoribosylglycinamide formyltransferase 1